jgi:LysR family glycine cleavage system transcriptional activator
LVPRLPRLDFSRDIRLRVSNGAPSLDFVTNDADIAVQWSDLPTPGLRVEPLMASARYPVISPVLLEREKVRRPEDLLRLTLFYDETDDAWPEWFAAAGLAGPTHFRYGLAAELRHCSRCRAWSSRSRVASVPNWPSENRRNAVS